MRNRYNETHSNYCCGPEGCGPTFTPFSGFRGHGQERGFGPGGQEGPGFARHRGRGFGLGGPDSPGFGHRGWRGGRGGHRPFDHGELRLVILVLIAERPRHGYEIIKAIEDKFAGSYSPSPGVVYPTLTMLEEIGNATVVEAEGKKLYSITEQGQAELTANKAAVDAAMARMAQDSESGQQRRAVPQIMRAMENMRMALRMRLRGGNMTEEQLKAIVNAIDSAAQTIERS